jgi:methionyl-tRNA formyltransferase
MIRIAFLGAKKIGFECLRTLHEGLNSMEMKIDAVFTNLERNVNTNTEIIKFANDRDIQTFESINQIIHLADFDFILSVQYHEILKEVHLQKAKRLAVNLHMAPLPEYRGCNQFSFAIIDGAKEFGSTLHQMTVGIDSGDIIAEKRFPIPSNCFVHELYNLTFDASIELFEKNIFNILSGEFQLTKQDSLISYRGTKTIRRKDIDKIKEIDLAWDSERIERHIRATLMPGFEPPFTFIKNKKIYFSDNY